VHQGAVVEAVDQGTDGASQGFDADCHGTCLRLVSRV
jgi:hypothetical protein